MRPNQSRSSLAALFALCGVTACFDIKLIPSENGAAGHAGAATGDTSGNGGAAAGGRAQGGRANGGSANAGATAAGGASLGGASNSAGGTASGGTNAASGGATSGGTSAASGGATSGGTSAASGGASALPSVHWLAFNGDQAPSTLSPNSDFGVNGVLYPYSDSCAVIQWDPATRCATGTLCDPGPAFANWGIAVGFDFDNTGAGGSPPNTKLLWNPDSVGALGVAWQISGTAPGLQLWVLNMDPKWNGQCNGDPCDIQGPPDGAPAPSLSGSLLFSNMQKDNWGGSGITYVFNPADVHALQFKIPAINVGAVSFGFCVQALGIIR